jgi:glucan phosphoethanolaminetransferase (alkaline phosphatase superfamily)
MAEYDFREKLHEASDNFNKDSNLAGSAIRADREWVRFGILQGVLGWISYAIIECWFVTILSFIFQGHSSPKRYHWGFTVILFFIYVLVGTIFGGIIGAVSYAWLKKKKYFSQLKFFTSLSIFTSLTITICFSINLITQKKFTLSVIGLVALTLMIVIALVLNFRSKSWYEKYGIITKPAIISVILLGESWILLGLFKDNNSRLVKAGAASSYLIGFIIISFLLRKYLRTRHLFFLKASGPKLYRGQVVYLTVILFITLALSARINRPYSPVISSLDNVPTTEGLPNIILIVMDTVRADHLSIYGYARDTTPNLMKFAKKAIVYNRAFASSDMTLSTHASLFTGMYPRVHGAHMEPPEYPYGKPLSDDFETITEVLSKKGY